jgi:hypothetical protein
MSKLALAILLFLATVAGAHDEPDPVVLRAANNYDSWLCYPSINNPQPCGCSCPVRVILQGEQPECPQCEPAPCEPVPCVECPLCPPPADMFSCQAADVSGDGIVNTVDFIGCSQLGELPAREACAAATKAYWRQTCEDADALPEPDEPPILD